MTGANTSFGQPSSSQGRHHQQSSTNGQHSPSPSTSQRASLTPFDQVKNQAKIDFEQNLRQRLGVLQVKKYSEIAGLASSNASRVTSDIDRVRQEKSQGFLPDNFQWNLLQRQLGSDRFVAAAVAGHLTAKFLGGTNAKDLQMRVEALEGLSEERFKEMLRQVRPSEEPHVSTTALESCMDARSFLG
jgi:hypothetical protein